MKRWLSLYVAIEIDRNNVTSHKLTSKKRGQGNFLREYIGSGLDNKFILVFKELTKPNLEILQ